MSAIIYCLKDPRTNQIRYVGKCENMRKRLQTHIADKRPCHKRSWIVQLLNLGLLPVMEKLEDVAPDESWQDRERFWITSLRSLRIPLTNMNEGGLGGYCPSAETRRKLRLAHLRKPKRPLTATERLAISERTKGVPRTRNQIEAVKRNNRLRVWTDEAKKAVSLQNGVRVKCVETGETFDSGIKASKFYGFNASSVARSARTGQGVHGLHFARV